MTKRYGEKQLEIIPPARPRVPAERVSPPEVYKLPARVDPHDLIERPFWRFGARSRAMTFDALGDAAKAEAKATRSHAELQRALIDHAEAWAEYDELGERLGTERYIRRVERAQELRALEHRAELAEVRHDAAVTEAEAHLVTARAELTQAQSRLVTAQEELVNAVQSRNAQMLHGDEYYSLAWERKIGEQRLYAEEQQAALDDHRKRVGLLGKPADIRAEFNADGRDTSELDAELAENRRRWRR